MRRNLLCAVLAAALGACAPVDEDDQLDEVIEIQGESGKADSPKPALLRRISSGLKYHGPTALAFNPIRPKELWVTNFDDDSVVIVHGAPTPTGRRSEYRKDGYALHFMDAPTSIAFGDDWTSFGIDGTFATCGDSRNTYENQAPPNDFMGPSLWSSDLSVFAKQDPYGLGSHLDMMHETPRCMGIAHERKNVYWVVGGLDNSIYRYDFGQDHDVGQDDHSDGRVARYATGKLARIPGIPSHLVYDSAAQVLYVADSGNSRIVKLDTLSGTRGGYLQSKESLNDAVVMVGAKLTDVVAASSQHLIAPSGLALKDDELWVSDAANGRISVFGLDGTRLRYYETQLGQAALAGITFGPDGLLYLVDRMGERVLRLEPK